MADMKIKEATENLTKSFKDLGVALKPIIEAKNIDRAIEIILRVNWEDYGQFKGEINHARELAVTALLQMAECVENKPLTVEELKLMGDKPYYHVSLTGGANGWLILGKLIAENPANYHYSERWLAYRYEPVSDVK